MKKGYVVFSLGVVLIFGGLFTLIFSLFNIVFVLAGTYLLYWTKKNSLSLSEVMNLLESFGFETEEEIHRATGVYYGSGPDILIGKMQGILVSLDVWWMMRDRDWPSKIKIYLTVPVRSKKLGAVEANGDKVRIPEVFRKYTDERDLALFRAIAAEFKNIKARFLYNHEFLWMIVNIESIEGRVAMENIRASINAFLKLCRIFEADKQYYSKVKSGNVLISGSAFSYSELELIKKLEKLADRWYHATAGIVLLGALASCAIYFGWNEPLRYIVIAIIAGFIALLTILLGLQQLDGKKALREWKRGVHHQSSRQYNIS